MDKWIETFRAAKPAKGHDRVLIPGDPERENEERISKEGINVMGPVQKEMKEIADDLGNRVQLSRIELHIITLNYYSFYTYLLLLF